MRDRITLLAEMPRRYKMMDHRGLALFGVKPSDFTCNMCDLKGCMWAYDGYNTNGDCLALK